jgi:hypothetical protein
MAALLLRLVAERSDKDNECFMMLALKVSRNLRSGDTNGVEA